MYSFTDKAALAEYIKHNLISSAEAADMLDCTRANISDLVRRGKLIPAVELSQTLLFWRDEVDSRRMQSPKAGRPKKPASD